MRIQLPRQPYEAIIQPGLLSGAAEHIAQIAGGDHKCFVVTVLNVRKAWEKPLAESLKAANLEANWLEMRDGERYKTLSSVEELAGRMVKLGADRRSLLIAFGGGVVGDTAGLLASLYMRGIALVQIPTTFLAQVDAAIGGKTGVNLTAGKNLMGTFCQPKAVLVDTSVLSTLHQIVQNAFSKQVALYKDIAKKTEALVREQVESYGLATTLPLVKIDEKKVDRTKQLQLYCYAISAKRYVLYNRDEQLEPVGERLQQSERADDIRSFAELRKRQHLALGIGEHGNRQQQRHHDDDDFDGGDDGRPGVAGPEITHGCRSVPGMGAALPQKARCTAPSSGWRG